MADVSAPTPELFSAYAEVFPPLDPKQVEQKTFLCLRRGVSSPYYFDERMAAFSLPTQRCFPSSRPWFWRQLLFSAYAEVFPAPTTLMSAWPPFLCLRRGVSLKSVKTFLGSNFSLPTQRCFWDEHRAGRRHVLFSAYAEVFLLSCCLRC